MFVGHFGLATIVKTKEKTLPLWVLLVGSQLLDIIFIPLWLLGIETIVPIGNGGYGEQIIHANYTHSLVGTLLITGIAGYVVAKIWNTRSGWVFAFMVFSHWVLDLVVHRMDMPILLANLGGLPLLGFGLWQLPILSKITEAMLVLVGIILYWKMCFDQTANQTDQHAWMKSKYLSAILVSAFLLLVFFFTT